MYVRYLYGANSIPGKSQNINIMIIIIMRNHNLKIFFVQTKSILSAYYGDHPYDEKVDIV